MTTQKLSAVLDHIDADFDNSLQRLFTLLRIKSISADPAFVKDCKQAADHLAGDLSSLGFSAEVRPTGGILQSSPRALTSAVGRTSSSMATTMCSPSIRSSFGTVRRSSPPLRITPTAARSSSPVAPRTIKAS